MTLVTFKDLVMDVVDPATLAPHWARWLHLREEIDEGGAVLRGERPEQTVWLNPAGPKTVKNRVHLDLLAHDLAPFADAARMTEPGRFPWTVFTDPDGAEFCVFESDVRPAGLKAVGVDAVDPRTIAAWWADVWGGTLESGDDYSSVEDVPGAPVESFDFAPVPEPKTVKNRIHWDVTLLPGVSTDDLVERGASVLLPEADDRRWTVMADPEGNEFCVFA